MFLGLRFSVLELPEMVSKSLNNLITHVSPPMGEQRTELIAEIYVGASVEACAGQAFDCAAFSRMPAETHG